MELSDISDAMDAAGFKVFGGLASTTAGLEAGGTLILVGNTGVDMWPVFCDEKPDTTDPLDTWTRERITAITDSLHERFSVPIEALFPFDGPPYHPFQRWALTSGNAHPSPIGPLIHTEFGLWHGYRAALHVDADLALPEPSTSASPCDDCTEKPCLVACPVEAFASGHLNVAACTSHLAGDHGEACFKAGCLARRACPIGTDVAYSEPQARFHMRAFFDAHR